MAQDEFITKSKEPAPTLSPVDAERLKIYSNNIFEFMHAIPVNANRKRDKFMNEYKQVNRFLKEQLGTC